jgi:pyrroline-5-carboxylate reductase
LKLQGKLEKMTASLVLAGCGKMGGAMLAGWMESGFIDGGIYVIDPITAATDQFSDCADVKIVGSAIDIPDSFVPSVVILAVKPQIMAEAILPLRRFVDPDTVFLSIAAGKTISYFEEKLGSNASIVRAMPNTPASVGRGITVYVPNNNASSELVHLCGELLSAVGEAILIEDESLLDPVTAVSGSGPAYVFFLIEAMAEAGTKAGLPEDLALRLARATVSGAGELAHLSNEPASQLRINVTSPGGTTAAALEVLMGDDGIQSVVDKAVAAASKRSRELAG